jgi:hypothetical protein
MNGKLSGPFQLLYLILSDRYSTGWFYTQVRHGCDPSHHYDCRSLFGPPSSLVAGVAAVLGDFWTSLRPVRGKKDASDFNGW